MLGASEDRCSGLQAECSAHSAKLRELQFKHKVLTSPFVHALTPFTSYYTWLACSTVAGSNPASGQDNSRITLATG